MKGFSDCRLFRSIVGRFRGVFLNRKIVFGDVKESRVQDAHDTNNTVRCQTVREYFLEYESLLKNDDAIPAIGGFLDGSILNWCEERSLKPYRPHAERSKE